MPPPILEKLKMDNIIKIITNFTPREDNLKYEHTYLDQEIQKNKLSMHIECCVHSGNLMHFLKKDAGCIQVPIPSENEQLCKKIYLRKVLEKYGLLLVSPKRLPHSYNELPYQLVLGWGNEYHVADMQRFGDDLTQEYLEYMSYFEICVRHSPYKTLFQASKFFNISPRAYDENKGVSGCYHQDMFLPAGAREQEEWDHILAAKPNQSEAVHIEEQLNAIGDRKECRVFRDVYSKSCEGLKQVYDFKDSHGLTVMKVIKQLEFDPRGAFKNYAPVTRWTKKGQPDSVLQIVPLPDKQILYHLDRFSECGTVVICPDLEIADQLQHENHLTGVVYTTFLCDDGCFNQVDFSPLKGKRIVILAMNHSSLNMLEVFRKCRALYDYLRNNEKIAEEELSVLVAEVAYHTDRKYFADLTDYLCYYNRSETPKVYADSVKLLATQQEFQDEYDVIQTHEQKLAELNHPYWYKGEATNETTENEAPVQSGYQLMRGILARGHITFINGEKGIGKTSFTASLAARLVNPSQRAPEFLEKRCWTLCKCAKEHPLKVVYLDYEGDNESFKNIRRDFVNAYLPANHEIENNLIFKHMDVETDYDFSADAYFEKFCEYLDNIAENEGTPRQPIDVLIFDTYWSFVRQRDDRYEVFGKLLHRYPQMAIIVEHHLNNGKPYGRKDKLFKVQTIINLTRETKKDKVTGTAKENKQNAVNLCTPFQVTVESKLSSFLEDKTPFDVSYNNQTKRFEVCDTNGSYGEYIKRLSDYYKETDRTLDELADVLGISVNTLSPILK